eukprot:759658-Hanusia_phi.AAC.1
MKREGERKRREREMRGILLSLLVPLLSSSFVASTAFQYGAASSAMLRQAACFKTRWLVRQRSTMVMNGGGGGGGGEERRKKVAVIGAGNVGGTTSFLLAMRNVADVVMLDVNEEVAKGKALDMTQAGNLCGYGGRIHGTRDYEELSMADVVVVTSGMPRKQGMTREDLVK